MLVLTRKVGQSIQIGEVTVMVTDIRRGKVRIGVSAPREVSVVRPEQKQKETDGQVSG